MKIDRQLAGDKELCIQLSGLDLRNAIYNLLTNARDAICQKQRNGHRNGADTLTIDITRNANDAVITIEDSGGGFSDEALKKLYEPFFTTKERGQGQGVISGTGIGLYITRKIIEECGGKMAVENSRQGAKIALTLPLS